MQQVMDTPTAAHYTGVISTGVISTGVINTGVINTGVINTGVINQLSQITQWAGLTGCLTDQQVWFPDFQEFPRDILMKME